MVHATNASGTWVLENISFGDDPSTAFSLYSFEIDRQNKGHIMHLAFNPNWSDIRYVTNAEIANTQGTWTYFSITELLNSPTGTTLAVDSTGTPHLIYSKDDKLHLAKIEGGSWVHSFITNVAPLTANRAVTFDSQDKLHISYTQRDTISSGPINLKYATNQTGTWIIQTAVDSVSGFWETVIAVD